MNFAVLADHRVKMKESEKIDKYLDLARELKKLLDMKLIVTPILFCSLGTVFKNLGKKKLAKTEEESRP